MVAATRKKGGKGAADVWLRIIVALGAPPTPAPPNALRHSRRPLPRVPLCANYAGGLCYQRV
jgi:hypothetical protein